MITLLEIAGYAIIAGTVAHVATNLISNVRRTAREAELQRETLELFRQRAQILVEAGLAERERAELSWNGFRKFRIEQKELEAEGIRSFYLRPHDQKELPPFKPGQYLTFQLRIPGHEKPVVRCYSLSDSPNDRDYYRVTIKHMEPPRDKDDAPPGSRRRSSMARSRKAISSM